MTLSKSARTRSTILAAAGGIFTTHNVASVTVEQIAEAAGVSVGTLYTHFPSKQGLLLAFVSESFAVVEQGMAEAHALPKAIDRVCAAGDVYLKFAVENPAAMRFAVSRVLQLDPSPELQEINQELSDRTQRMVLTIAADAREMMSDAETPPVPIDEMMVFLWGLWNGVTGLVIRQDGTAIPPELAARALELARVTLKRAALHALEHPEPPR